jgi:hypothetical protein
MVAPQGSLRLIAAVLALLAVSFGCASVSAGNGSKLDPKKRISVKQAEELVYEILQDPRHQHGLEPYKPLSPEFYGFEVVVPNPGGSGVIGHFMVNPWNGDVWDDDDPCHLVETPTLSELQSEIRKRLGLSKAEFAAASALRPFCYQVP